MRGGAKNEQENEFFNTLKSAVIWSRAQGMAIQANNFQSKKVANKKTPDREIFSWHIWPIMSCINFFIIRRCKLSLKIKNQSFSSKI